MENKFNKLYHAIIKESATSIFAEEIVIDIIQDEFLENGYTLKDTWRSHVSPIVEYVNENMPEDKTIETIDYLDLVKLVDDALHTYHLVLTCFK
jgi:hypothetical protein